MGIVVIGATFVDIKGFPNDTYIPDGRNAGRVEYIQGGVARNVVEDIANMELRPTFLGIVDDTPMGDDVIHKLQNIWRLPLLCRTSRQISAECSLRLEIRKTSFSIPNLPFLRASLCRSCFGPLQRLLR